MSSDVKSGMKGKEEVKENTEVAGGMSDFQMEDM